MIAQGQQWNLRHRFKPKFLLIPSPILPLLQGRHLVFVQSVSRDTHDGGGELRIQEFGTGNKRP